MLEAIFSDLDGTLLNTHHQVDARMSELLVELQGKGVQIFLASGRHYEDMRHIASHIGLHCPLISSNGAYIHDENGKLLFSRSIGKTEASYLLSLILPEEVGIHFYTQSRWYVIHDTLGSRVRYPILFPYSGFRPVALESGDRLKVVLEGEDVLKVYFSGKLEILGPLSKQLHEETLIQNLACAYGGKDTLEFTAPEVNKGTAIKEICKVRGIDLQKTVAFGDGENDVEMLQTTAMGFLMDQALPSVKEALKGKVRMISHPKYFETLKGLQDEGLLP